MTFLSSSYVGYPPQKDVSFRQLPESVRAEISAQAHFCFHSNGTVNLTQSHIFAFSIHYILEIVAHYF